jgi:hypothetical protein
MWKLSFSTTVNFQSFSCYLFVLAQFVIFLNKLPEQLFQIFDALRNSVLFKIFVKKTEF